MTDKAKHFIAGFIITAALGLTVGLCAGLAAGIIAGAAKELYDRAGYGTPDIQDFVVTVTGSGLAAAVMAAVG